ncbi:LysR family transcriptional regulator [uncultured Megasphaera sp.]|uniref:LysR family transcriptional regulator n=1 Tax=uncultured Megasphaera sp. TaxID=165188 RepID=UPI0028063C18|nr:LysR family transcriptional regulator [uncultured Megasphaera sp.]
MTLQQLRYVIAVAERGNITQAARHLFVSQPSITAAVRDLEREMDITIFLRQNKGVTLTPDGERFLGYARKVIDEADQLEDTFKGRQEQKPRFAVSCQHYSFAVNAFVQLIRQFDAPQYDFTLREEQTHEIIDDVANLKSELGILYLSFANEKILRKILAAQNLTFTELFTARPHVFISSRHPLAGKDVITLKDLQDYPYLTYEQGVYNSFYYKEEFLDSTDQKKNICVRDRATLFNLVIGLNGYTVCSGVISHALNGDNIIAKPLKMKEEMKIGVILRKDTILSRYGKAYLEHLKESLP